MTRNDEIEILDFHVENTEINYFKVINDDVNYHEHAYFDQNLQAVEIQPQEVFAEYMICDLS